MVETIGLVGARIEEEVVGTEGRRGRVEDHDDINLPTQIVARRLAGGRGAQVPLGEDLRGLKTVWDDLLRAAPPAELDLTAMAADRPGLSAWSASMASLEMSRKGAGLDGLSNAAAWAGVNIPAASPPWITAPV